MRGLLVWIALTPTGLDVGGAIVIDAPVHTLTAGLQQGVSLPHVALVDPTTGPSTVRHELRHQAQWDALGPALVPAYALTAGRPFEDYLDPDGSMWMPPPNLRRSCPLARLTKAGVSLMPCWRF